MSEARRLCEVLGGDWRVNSGLAPCPVCQPEGRRDQRALAISDNAGQTLVYCHKSGCSVLSELQARRLVSRRGCRAERPNPTVAVRRRTAEAKRKARLLESAQDLFAAAVSCTGTPAATYLEYRGIVGLRLGKLARTIRFHSAALHGPTGARLPAMVAQIRGPRGEALGVHRTYLQPDGLGKADVHPAKMMLGPSAGGAVRFGPDAKVIALAEGIETALSVSYASRLTVWATLSTSGLKALKLPPPPLAEVVVIAADHDTAGMAAARQKAAELEAQGRAVSVIFPPLPGTDFNDVLRGSV